MRRTGNIRTYLNEYFVVKFIQSYLFIVKAEKQPIMGGFIIAV